MNIFFVCAFSDSYHDYLLLSIVRFHFVFTFISLLFFLFFLDPSNTTQMAWPDLVDVNEQNKIQFDFDSTPTHIINVIFGGA
jgi:thiosulfate reductase cytochrome b subunit